MEFSSPCGDKLQCYTERNTFEKVPGFRPLAGINCNVRNVYTINLDKEFSSPCGDKLQSIEIKPAKEVSGFSSPCGDKLQCSTRFPTLPLALFSSPCGDKLQCNGQGANNNSKRFSSPCGDKLQWQNLLTDHGKIPQKAESCIVQQHYTSFCRKRKGLFGQRGGVLRCEPVTEVRKKANYAERFAPQLHRRSTDGMEKAGHNRYLDSAEGASKP